MSRGLTRCFPNRENFGAMRLKLRDWDGWVKGFTTGGTEEHRWFGSAYRRAILYEEYD
jgi:hypothetical protein